MAFPQEVTDADLPQRPSRGILEDHERGDERTNFLPREGSGQMVRCGSLRETRRPRHYMW